VSLVHEAMYYSHLDEFFAGAVSFIDEGRGQPALIAVPEPRLSALRDRLGFAAAKISFIDMADEGRNPNRIIPWVLATFVEEHPGPVRIIGEPVFVGRGPEEVAACVQHEALINVALADGDLIILCPYDVRQLSHVVPYAERTHPVVRDGRGRRLSTSYTDPHTVVALLNQPLPERRRVDEVMVFDRKELRGLRHRIGEYAMKAGMTESRVGDLQIAANEIGTNAVVHSGSDGGLRATLRLWCDEDRLICEIRGAGEISDIMAGRVVPSPDSPRGRGLLIANRLCDLVQTHTAPTGTTTRLHMRLSPT
jgi:anti-sigma regulatory factor (Ser/Thr protein kinase)